MRVLGRRGQQIGEYAVLIGIVATAFLSMQMYMSRRVASRLVGASHAVLGSLTPADDGSSNSNSTETVREAGTPWNIHTTSQGSSSGSSSSGFILAEAPGPYMGAALTFHDPNSVEELVSALLGDGETLEELSTSESGLVSALIKTKDGKKRLVHFKMTKPIQRIIDKDGNLIELRASLDTDEDGKADRVVSAFPTGVKDLSMLKVAMEETFDGAGGLLETLDGMEQSLKEEERIPGMSKQERKELLEKTRSLKAKIQALKDEFSRAWHDAKSGKITSEELEKQVANLRGDFDQVEKDQKELGKGIAKPVRLQFKTQSGDEKSVMLGEHGNVVLGWLPTEGRGGHRQDDLNGIHIDFNQDGTNDVQAVFTPLDQFSQDDFKALNDQNKKDAERARKDATQKLAEAVPDQNAQDALMVLVNEYHPDEGGQPIADYLREEVDSGHYKAYAKLYGIKDKDGLDSFKDMVMGLADAFENDEKPAPTGHSAQDKKTRNAMKIRDALKAFEGVVKTEQWNTRRPLHAENRDLGDGISLPFNAVLKDRTYSADGEVVLVASPDADGQHWRLPEDRKKRGDKLLTKDGTPIGIDENGDGTADLIFASSSGQPTPEALGRRDADGNVTYEKLNVDDKFQDPDRPDDPLRDRPDHMEVIGISTDGDSKNAEGWVIKDLKASDPTKSTQLVLDSNGNHILDYADQADHPSFGLSANTEESKKQDASDLNGKVTEAARELAIPFPSGELVDVGTNGAAGDGLPDEVKSGWSYQSLSWVGGDSSNDNSNSNSNLAVDSSSPPPPVSTLSGQITFDEGAATGHSPAKFLQQKIMNNKDGTVERTELGGHLPPEDSKLQGVEDAQYPSLPKGETRRSEPLDVWVPANPGAVQPGAVPLFSGSGQLDTSGESPVSGVTSTEGLRRDAGTATAPEDPRHRH